jgi:HPt (histidine-containing phosphotransfer) domain-containing protein
MNDTNLTDLPIMDNATITELKEIMAEDFPDLVKTLLRDMPSQLTEITQAVMREDANTLYLTAHKLKSGTASIGALQLSELARQLEEKGRSGYLVEVKALLNEIHHSAELTRVSYRNLLTD